MTAVRSVRVAWIAGTRPKITALATATARLNTSARRSIWNASAIGRSVGSLDLPEQRHAGVADAETEHAAGGGDEQALGHQLADEPPASGADREAQRHFARAHRRAAGQQTGDVGARDEQHGERERGEHRDEHRVRRALRRSGLQLGADAEPPVLVRVSGYARSRSAAMVVNSACASRLRHARLEAAFQPQIPRVALLERAWRFGSLISRGDIISGTKKSDRTNWSRPVNSGGATPITVNSLAVDPHAAAEDARIRRELLLPHRAAQHDDGVAAGHLIFFWPEGASDRWARRPSARTGCRSTSMPSLSLGVALGSVANPTVTSVNAARPVEALAAIADVHVVAIRGDQRAGAERFEVWRWSRR